jgi:hypothetical protein
VQTNDSASVLLTPIKELFDFERQTNVAAGDSVTVAFNVTAAAVAVHGALPLYQPITPSNR